MTLFEPIFVATMLLTPALIALLIRECPAPDDDLDQRRSEIRRRSIALWLGTGAAFGLAGALFLIAGSPRLWQLAWALFFPLWFGLALPLIRLKNHGWRGQLAQQPVRAARLTPRTPLTAPLWLELGLWTVWGAGTALVVYQVVFSPQTAHGWLLVLTLASAVWLWAGRWGAAMSAVEPEPLDPDSSPELVHAYETFRRRKAQMWLAFGAAGMVVFLAPAVLLSWFGQQAQMVAIILGAGGGSLFGIAGGVVGTWMDFHRAKINRIYRRVSDASAGVNPKS